MSAGNSLARLKQGGATSLTTKLEKAGFIFSRYGLVVVLVLIGALKFTAAEAAGIQPLISHSPFMSWMYVLLGRQGVSNVIGIIELGLAFLIVLRPVSAKLSFVGSAGAVVTFLLTSSFIFSTPRSGPHKPRYACFGWGWTVPHQGFGLTRGFTVDGGRSPCCCAG
jgi:uncharacterized membrane protein YkgB